MGDRFGAEDQDAVSLRGDGKSPPDLAVYLDSVMGTDRKALAAADARLIVDDRQKRLVHRHRDGIGGADANASQARDAELGVNDEIQGLVRQREGLNLQFDGPVRDCQDVRRCKVCIQLELAEMHRFCNQSGAESRVAELCC